MSVSELPRLLYYLTLSFHVSKRAARALRQGFIFVFGQHCKSKLQESRDAFAPQDKVVCKKNLLYAKAIKNARETADNKAIKRRTSYKERIEDVVVENMCGLYTSENEADVESAFTPKFTTIDSVATHQASATRGAKIR